LVDHLVNVVGEVLKNLLSFIKYFPELLEIFRALVRLGNLLDLGLEVFPPGVDFLVVLELLV